MDWDETVEEALSFLHEEDEQFDRDEEMRDLENYAE